MSVRLSSRFFWLGLSLSCGLAGCAAPQPGNMGHQQLEGIRSLPETLNVVGVRGILGGMVKTPVSATLRCLHQVAGTVTTALGPNMERINGRTTPAPLSGHRGMDIGAFEAELDRKIRPIKTRGAARFLIDGPQFFPVLTRAIREAREPINAQIYIFDNDDVAVAMADELKAASHRVPVRVLFDDLGTQQAAYVDPQSKVPAGFTPPDDIFTYLQQGSAIDVRRLHNVFLTSVHTKIITIGTSRAFTGGMNFGREYRYDWHDLMIELRGPIVGVLQNEFERAWAHTDVAGDVRHWFKRVSSNHGAAAIPAPRNAFDIRILHTRPFDANIEKALHLAMQRAQRRIWIEDPYFADDRLIRALIDARDRGVDVRVILPNKSDARIMGGSNKVTASVLLRHGIRVFTYPRTHHVKAALFDDWALTGSANFDHLSLRVNEEVDIAFSHPPAVRELETRLFLQDFKICKEMKDGSVKPGLKDTMAEMLADHL